MVWNCPNNFIYYTTYRELFLVEDKRNSLKSFCNTWYSTWHNILAQYFRKKKKHIGNTYHSDAVQEAMEITRENENSVHLCRMYLTNILYFQL